MGRYAIKEEDLRHPIKASVRQKVIDTLGLLECKEIAENAVNKEYEKRLKQK